MAEDSDSSDDDERPKRNTSSYAGPITASSGWDDQSGPAIISPDPAMMKSQYRSKLREDKNRRYSISAMTNWDDDDGHKQAQQSYDYFAQLQDELTRKRQKTRRSIIRRRSASITNVRPGLNFNRDKEIGNDFKVPSKDELRQDQKKMNGQLQVQRNRHFGGSKSVSAANMWREEDDEDDGMDIDLDAYTKKKNIGKKRESKVKFALPMKELNAMRKDSADGNESDGSVIYHSRNNSNESPEKSRPKSSKHSNERPKSSKHANGRPKSSKFASKGKSVKKPRAPPRKKQESSSEESSSESSSDSSSGSESDSNSESETQANKPNNKRKSMKFNKKR